MTILFTTEVFFLFIKRHRMLCKSGGLVTKDKQLKEARRSSMKRIT